MTMCRYCGREFEHEELAETCPECYAKLRTGTFLPPIASVEQDDWWIPVKWVKHDELADPHHITIDLIPTSPNDYKFAVRNGVDCLNKNGQWEYEPMPSSRDDEFLKRCRFDSWEEARKALYNTGRMGKKE